jgi:hypothetical protein
VGGVAGSDQTTSSAMTIVAAMMSNVFLSIRIPLVRLPSGLLHSFSPLKVFASDQGREKGGIKGRRLNGQQQSVSSGTP